MILNMWGNFFFENTNLTKLLKKSSSDVKVHLSYLTIALSRNDKINPKTEKIQVNQTSKMSYSIEAVTGL